MCLNTYAGVLFCVVKVYYPTAKKITMIAQVLSTLQELVYEKIIAYERFLAGA